MAQTLLTGAETIAAVRAETDTILLSFSGGKDSICTWLECRRHFPRIIPFFMYLVPNLAFVERSMRYYESWFGQRIMRLPHPSLYRMLRNFVFQPPNHISIIEAASLPIYDHADVYTVIRTQLGLPDAALCATGVRSADSPDRRIAMKRHGSIHRRQGHFYPIHDWSRKRVYDELVAAGVQLPAEYRWFGRSFDGLDYRFLAPIKEHYPADYRRILEFFPLAELELIRREFSSPAESPAPSPPSASSPRGADKARG